MWSPAHTAQRPPTIVVICRGMPGTDLGTHSREGTQRIAKERNPELREALSAQRDANRRKNADRTAKPLFAGSIPARASLRHNDLRGSPDRDGRALGTPVGT